MMFKFIRLKKMILYALAGFLFVASDITHADRRMMGFERYGGEITESDKMSLPPVCRLILFEKPTAQLQQSENADLFSRPEYRMAKNNIHLHHYCYGQLSKHRFFISDTRAKRNTFANHFQEELDYVLRNSDKSWPFFDQLYFEQAEMFFYTGDNVQAVSKAMKALSITPGYVKAHALLSDIYMRINRRDAALNQLHVGLAANPSSKYLLKKLLELDPKDPLLTQPIPEPPQSSDATVSEEPSSPSNENIKPSPIDNSAGGLTQDEPTSKPTVTPNPGNPYCRFCP